MAHPIVLSDFRARRYKLDPDDFALGDDSPDDPPTDLVDEETWSEMTHLPDDVAIRTSDHNGSRLKLLQLLWGGWVTTTASAGDADELSSAMLDAGDAFQCATFMYLHGYYRAAMSELRVALELVTVGAYGNLNTSDADYKCWKNGSSDLRFTRFRRRMHGLLRKDQCKQLVADGGLLDKTFRQLCHFTHAQPNETDGALWQSNGPVYAHNAAMLFFFTATSVFAICYLLVRIARPGFTLPVESRILFEEDWIPGREALEAGFDQLFGKAARRSE